MASLVSPFTDGEITDALSTAAKALRDVIVAVAAKGDAASEEDRVLANHCRMQIDVVTALMVQAVANELNSIFATENDVAQQLRAVIKKMKETAHTIDSTVKTWKTCVNSVSGVIDILTSAFKAPGGVLMGVISAWTKWAAPAPSSGTTPPSSPGATKPA